MKKRQVLVLSILLSLISSLASAELGPILKFQAPKITKENISQPGYFSASNLKNSDEQSHFNDDVLIPLYSNPAQFATGYDETIALVSLIDNDAINPNNWNQIGIDQYFDPNLRVKYSHTNFGEVTFAQLGQLNDQNPDVQNSNRIDIVTAHDSGYLNAFFDFDGINIKNAHQEIFLNPTNACQDPSRNAVINPLKITWLELADINQDGNLDILASQYCSGTLVIFLGDGKGGFSDQVNALELKDTYVTSFTVIKENNEYDLVATTAGFGDGRPAQLLFLNYDANLGDFRRIKNTDLTSCLSVKQIVAGQFDQDDDLEFALSCPEPRQDLVPGQNPNPGYVLIYKDLIRKQIIEGNYPWGIAIADFNLDGRTDLAIANSNSNSIAVHRGNGDGSFESSNLVTPIDVQSRPSWVQAYDFNNDDRPDISLVTHALNAFVRPPANLQITDRTLDYINGDFFYIPDSVRVPDGSIISRQSLNKARLAQYLPSEQSRVYLQRIGGAVLSNSELGQLQDGGGILADQAPQSSGDTFQVILNQEPTVPQITASSVECQDDVNQEKSIEIFATINSSIKITKITPEELALIDTVVYENNQSYAKVTFPNTQTDYVIYLTLTDELTKMSDEKVLEYKFASVCPGPKVPESVGNPEAPVNPATTSAVCPETQKVEILEGDTMQVCAPAEFADKNIQWKQVNQTDYKYFDVDEANNTGNNCITIQAPNFPWNADFTSLDVAIEYSANFNVTLADGSQSTQELTCDIAVTQNLMLYEGHGCSIHTAKSQNHFVWILLLALLLSPVLITRTKK